MEKKILFPNNEVYKDTHPVYENYAIFHRRAIELLQVHKKGDWAPIDLEISQYDTSLIEMMENNLIKYDVLATIFESKPSNKISSRSEYSLDTKLENLFTFDNKLVFFPDYEVAITNAYQFSFEHSWHTYHFFATSPEKALHFLTDIDEMMRKLLMQSVTYLVDTENGIQRRKYGEQAVVNREDVLLEDQIKQDIFRSIDEFFKEDGRFFKEYGLPYKRGILLYGSPGNGKTTLVKSITGSTKAPVVYWQITEFTGSHSIQGVFGIVTRLAPAILVIEDIDSMPEYTRSIFLNTLDGVQSREGLFIIGTTNYPEKIDPALINRAGRFDRAYEIPAPSEKQRRVYLSKLDIKKIFSEEQLADAAKLSHGLSMSQLNELYMSVALNYHYDGELGYVNRIKELLEQNKRSSKNAWEDSDSSIGF